MSDLRNIYQLDDGGSQIIVDSRGVTFQLRDRPSDAVRLAKADLVSAMSRASKKEWVPDVVVVIYRDSDGHLEHFTWSLASKRVARDVSKAIYSIIDARFWKAFLGFFYALTHRIEFER